MWVPAGPFSGLRLSSVAQAKRLCGNQLLRAAPRHLLLSAARYSSHRLDLLHSGQLRSAGASVSIIQLST